MEKVSLAEKFAAFSDFWSPKLVGEINDAQVKLAKFKGEFVWHQHAEADELFLVIKGTLRIRLKSHEVTLGEGELFIVPKGVEHLPIADEECHVLLLEPKGTVNTGNVVNDLTVLKIQTL